MAEKNYQGIGNISYGGNTGYTALVSGKKGGGIAPILPTVILAVIVILLGIAAIGRLKGPSEAELKKPAETYMNMIINALTVGEDEAFKKDREKIQNSYPEDWAITQRIMDGLELDIGAEILDMSTEIKYNGSDMIRDKEELQKYAACISLAEGMEDESIAVTAGAWFEYGITVSSEDYNGEIIMKLLVLECNGKPGVWGMGGRYPDDDPDTEEIQYMWTL